jgi:hypothetical protein
VTGIEDRWLNQQTISFSMQSFPNPFTLSTNIFFQLPSRSTVTLKIYDIMGREVTTVFSGELEGGEHLQQWSPENLPSGIYLYRVQTDYHAESNILLYNKNPQ